LQVCTATPCALHASMPLEFKSLRTCCPLCWKILNCVKNGCKQGPCGFQCRREKIASNLRQVFSANMIHWHEIITSIKFATWIKNNKPPKCHLSWKIKASKKPGLITTTNHFQHPLNNSPHLSKLFDSFLFIVFLFRLAGRWEQQKGNPRGWQSAQETARFSMC
jgi:hypothetical protein